MFHLVHCKNINLVYNVLDYKLFYLIHLFILNTVEILVSYNVLACKM